MIYYFSDGKSNVVITDSVVFDTYDRTFTFIKDLYENELRNEKENMNFLVDSLIDECETHEPVLTSYSEKIKLKSLIEDVKKFKELINNNNN